MISIGYVILNKHLCSTYNTVGLNYHVTYIIQLHT